MSAAITAAECARAALAEIPAPVGAELGIPRPPRVLDLMAHGVLEAVAADIDARIASGLRGYSVVGLLLARTELRVRVCWDLARAWGVGPRPLAEGGR